MDKKFYRGQVTLDVDGGCRLDRRTTLLAASALFIFGSFIGCAVYRILGIGESELYDNLIERYFLALFYKCDSTLDVIRVTADCCIHELWMFAAVFLSGFTLFTHAVSAALLLYRGLLFGFSVTMLQFSSKTGLLLDSMIYIFAALALSVLLAILCTEASQFYTYDRAPRLKSMRSRQYLNVFLRICTLVCADIILMLFLIYVYF